MTDGRSTPLLAGALSRRRVTDATLSRRPTASYIVAQQNERNPATAKFPVMLDNVYNRRILELAADIPRLGRLPRPQASADAYSKLCGSTITVDLSLQDGRVADYAQELKACALGQASASILARNIVGATPEELRDLRETMRRMLKENGPPPSGRWADLAVLEPVRDYKARHGSVMLPFDATAAALDKIEATAEGDCGR